MNDSAKHSATDSLCLYICDAYRNNSGCTTFDTSWLDSDGYSLVFGVIYSLPSIDRFLSACVYTLQWFAPRVTLFPLA